MDTFRLYGELLTSNLYRIPNSTNLDQITLENYYDNNDPITIPLDKSISPSANAKKYFKKYHKLKNALEIVSNQKKETEKEIEYLESIVYEIEHAKTIEEIDDIYYEIQENVLFQSNIKSKKNTINKNKKSSIETPISYIISDFTVLVGKNNKQNDYITLKLARHNDIWFHTKDIHGSHVILCTNGNTPSDDILKSCAQLAAYYSKGKLSSNVPVDYTLVKHVKKPSGSKPGMVIYTNQKTLYVGPKLPNM